MRQVAESAGIRLPFADAAEEARAVAARGREPFLDAAGPAPRRADRVRRDPGAVAAEGARRGVPTPVNGMLWLLLRAATEGKGNR